MKKIIALLLACLFACQLPLALAGTSWYCPQCGRLNDNNFCPVDGTARPADTGSSSYPGITTSTDNYTTYAYITGTLNAKLATRTGPGTQYDEPGTFLSAGSQVTVLSKAYDTRNEIWWIQVEFSVSGSRYRAYTGLKRFTNLNVSYVPEEKVIGSCTTGQSITGYYGPGYNYNRINKKVPAGVSCTIYGYASSGDSDFIQIEFYDRSQGRYRRAWIPDWYADNVYMYYGF